MNFKETRTEQLLAELWEQNPGRDATGARISRRKLLRSSAGTAVVATVGMSGLLELLSNREAFAAGMVIVIVGVTREPNLSEETPHRHTFSVRFQITSISPAPFPEGSVIMGNVAGRTEAVISTGSVPEDQHWHLIQMANAS